MVTHDTNAMSTSEVTAQHSTAKCNEVSVLRVRTANPCVQRDVASKTLDATQCAVWRVQCTRHDSQVRGVAWRASGCAENVKQAAPKKSGAYDSRVVGGTPNSSVLQHKPRHEHATPRSDEGRASIVSG
jgi:hypothetical protein